MKLIRKSKDIGARILFACYHTTLHLSYFIYSPADLEIMTMLKSAQVNYRIFGGTSLNISERDQVHFGWHVT